MCYARATTLSILHMEIYGKPYVRRVYIDAAEAKLVSVGLAQDRPNKICSKSEIKGLRICSAFLLNDFSHKQLSEGATNCAIIIALNISLRTSPPRSMLTMSVWLVIKLTQEEAGERALPKMLAITFFRSRTIVRMAAAIFS